MFLLALKLVAGSAIHAFEVVCPERIDLIHKNFRKLCNLLIDVDEWGQVIIINMLTRYSRTQFVDPNQGDKSPRDQKDCNDDDKAVDDDDDNKNYIIDPDHRLLLRNTRPLLQSRNSSVSVKKVWNYGIRLVFFLRPKTNWRVSICQLRFRVFQFQTVPAQFMI